MMFAIPFPSIDPVLIEIGPFAIRWYALAYIAGIVLGWRYCLYLAARPPRIVTRAQFGDFVVWAVLGVILGGRLGYVLFYKPLHYLYNPLEIVMVWQGGMSFHGGMLGVILAMILFTRQRRLPFFALADIVACATPIGLFFGRLANFINQELYGRPTDVPWAVVFPAGGPLPRHPSQLYEAALEGVVLFVVLFALARFTEARWRLGVLSGVFLVGYSLSRIIVELFREPDAHLGYLIGGTTMGQWLSVPMLLVGLVFILRARRVQVQ
ncbi:prolipoprotein diacylglyceryl transferase [Rhodospirillaceae bacterium SYSU D60014]|uniref:prolipoprotein diacylglyceryl transferase n=1 Tax=Virgifigura deserti TaxID=2268457 RepID=UPI000E675FDD